MEKRPGALANLCKCATKEDSNQKYLQDVTLTKPLTIVVGMSFIRNSTVPPLETSCAFST